MRLFLPFLVAVATASRITFKQVKQHHPSLHRRADQVNVVPNNDGQNKFDIESVRDLIYLADITVGGVDYPVQLDTGSSDLFVKGESYPIPNTEESNLMHNLTYAIGWAYGHISFAAVDFVGIPIPKQAFLDAETVKNPALELGARGIVGLGFNRLSAIDNELNITGSSLGRSMLYNLFAANPSEPNFIAFALHRSSQSDDEVEGSFAIGEFEPEYSAILGNAPISTWPVHDPYRWNVLLDAIVVNSTITPGTSKVPGAPSNKAVVLLDSGSSHTYAPQAAVEAIYGGVPGAEFDATIGLWRVPCSEEINVALQIGGQVFPIHPLDLVISRNSVNKDECVGTFIPTILEGSNWDFDWLIGDNFLRSVYSIYDFGDYNSAGQMGDPYVKMLALVDPDEASVDFHSIRGGEPRTNITFVGLDGVSIAPSFSISTDISESLDMIGRYLPAMLAVVAFNALVIVVGSIVWLVLFIRRRKRRSFAREPRARTGTRPNSARPGSTRPNSYIAGVDPDSPPPVPHVYEPVSMALTEDTFVPPSPAFYGRSNGKLQAGSLGERPKSVA